MSILQKGKWKLAQKLEYLWWVLYLRKKDVNEYLYKKDIYWKSILEKISTHLPALQQQTILDAGCGPAGIFMLLNENKVTAIDPLIDQYEKLAHFIPAAYPWTTFKQVSLEQLDTVEEYDIIFCLNAINHVNNIELAYNNLLRALKPDGILVVSTDAHRSHFLKKIFQWLPGDALHPIQLSIEEYNQKLIDRDMKILEDSILRKESIFNYHITVAKKP